MPITSRSNLPLAAIEAPDRLAAPASSADLLAGNLACTTPPRQGSVSPPANLQPSAIKAICAQLMSQLPVDGTLRGFLQGHGLVMPEGFEWIDTHANANQLITALFSQTDPQACERLVAGLHLGLQLANSLGKHAIYQAIAASSHRLPPVVHDALLAGFAGCQSDAHRSFWLFVHHPILFEQAVGMAYADPTHLQYAQQHALGPGQLVRRDAIAVAALCEEIKSIYVSELGAHPSYAAYLHDRQGTPQLLTISAKSTELSRERSLFSAGASANAPVNISSPAGPSHITVMVEYCARTGIARTLIAGGYREHALLARAFARHLLAKLSLPTEPLQSAQHSDIDVVLDSARPVLHHDAIAMEPGSTASARAACHGPFSDDFRWVHLNDWNHGPIVLSLMQAAVFKSLWSFGGTPQFAERIMLRAGSRCDKPMDVFKMKSVNKGDPRYEGPLHAYRTLVKVDRQTGTYAMPCAAAKTL